MIKNLVVDYKEIKRVEFTAKNGIVVTAEVGGYTVSIVHKASFVSGIQADFTEEDLAQYIGYLQNMHDQIKNR